MSDLRYKENILGSSERKLEPRNKEFDCRKDKGVAEKENRPTNTFNFENSHFSYN